MAANNGIEGQKGRGPSLNLRLSELKELVS